MKINKSEIKNINAETAREAKNLLSREGSRLSLVAAFVYITASAGAGLIASYLPFYLLDYFSVNLSDLAEYAIMFASSFFFAAPALAGMRHVAAALCDGREVSLGEMFVAFSSFERFCAAYLSALALFLRYAVAAFILYSPEIVEDMIFGSSEEIPGYFYAAALAIVLILAVAWLILTRRLTRIFYFLWSRKMTFFKALGAAFKQRYIPAGVFTANLLNILLSAAACFTFYIYHAGPLFAIESELSMRRQDKIYEKSRKDGQK